MSETLFTIGHSTHPLRHFFELLERHGITALCDVRSKPYSRANPQFNREVLKNSLREHGISYVFLGEELGARSKNPECYLRGKVQYELLARTALFLRGIERIRQGMENYRLALMCAEREPLECHRTILVARNLVEAGIGVQHIHADGSLETHEHAIGRLLHQLQLVGHSRSQNLEEVIAAAYKIQGERIAYQIRGPEAAETQLVMGGLE